MHNPLRRPPFRFIRFVDTHAGSGRFAGGGPNPGQDLVRLPRSLLRKKRDLLADHLHPGRRRENNFARSAELHFAVRGGGGTVRLSVAYICQRHIYEGGCFGITCLRRKKKAETTTRSKLKAGLVLVPGDDVAGDRFHFLFTVSRRCCVGKGGFRLRERPSLREGG